MQPIQVGFLLFGIKRFLKKILTMYIYTIIIINTQREGLGVVVENEQYLKGGKLIDYKSRGRIKER